MSVLASQALLIPYQEESGLILASVGEVYMGTPTLVLTIRCGHGEVAGVAAGVVGAAGAGLHLIGTSGGRTTN